MPVGLLEADGTIDLAQFWPQGDSDADTVKVLLSGANAFRFRPHAGAAFKVTHAFNGATVRGKVSKSAIDKQGRITIRLQGIDAGELHYRPTAPTLNGKKPTAAQRTKFNAANGNFRQHFGETAAMKLAGFLATVGSSPVHCVVRTAVDHPGDVFDAFGRFVGNIIVTANGKEADANLWLCEHGWAFPTFYSSMMENEIEELIKLAAKARKNKSGIWGKVTSNLTKFDRSLVFRNHGTPNPVKDAGPVIMPKLFRRQSTFEIAKLAGMTSGHFNAYLAKEPDPCFETADFLKSGINAATPRQLDQFVTAAGKFTVGSGDVVFQEHASKVVDANGNPAHW